MCPQWVTTLGTLDLSASLVLSSDRAKAAPLPRAVNPRFSDTDACGTDDWPRSAAKRLVQAVSFVQSRPARARPSRRRFANGRRAFDLAVVGSRLSIGP